MMAIFYHWQKSNLNTMEYQNCLHFSFSFVFGVTRQKQLYHLLPFIVAVLPPICPNVAWHFHWNGPFKTDPRMKNLRYFFFLHSRKTKTIPTLFRTATIFIQSCTCFGFRSTCFLLCLPLCTK